MSSLSRVSPHIQISTDTIEALRQKKNVALVHQENGGYVLQEAGCGNNFCRSWVPGSAVRCDTEILGLFQEVIRDHLQGGEVVDDNVINAAQGVISLYAGIYPCEDYKPSKASSEPGHMVALLERYVRAVDVSVELQNPANRMSLEKWMSKGFDEGLFYSHPDFVEFIFNNNLHNMVKYYIDNPSPEGSITHQIFKDPNSGEPQILVNGEQKNWSEIKGLIALDDKGQLDGWFYTQDLGLVQYDWSGWATIEDCKPIRVLPEDQRPDTAQFTIVTAIKQFAQGAFKREHTSFRLTLTDGREYSFGLWSDPKLQDGGVPTACETGVGDFVCPDTYEFMGDNVVLETTSFSMTEKQLQAMIATLEKCKAEGVPFHWWNHNCSVFVCELLKIIDIELDMTETLFNLLPQCMQDAALCIWYYIPSFIKCFIEVVFKVISIAMNVFFNSILVIFMGATRGLTRRVSTLEGEREEKIAMISSWGDFFFKGLSMRLPRKLLEFQRQVTTLRGEEIERVEGELQTLEQGNENRDVLQTGDSCATQINSNDRLLSTTGESEQNILTRIQSCRKKIKDISFGVPERFRALPLRTNS